MKTTCPICGVNVRLELHKTVVAHPVNHCQLSGRAFRVAKAKGKDKRKTWDEICAKNTFAGTPEPINEPIATENKPPAPEYDQTAGPVMPTPVMPPPPVKPESP